MNHNQTAMRASLLAILVAGIYCSNAFAGTFTVKGTFIPDAVQTTQDQELPEDETQPSQMAEATVKVFLREKSNTMGPTETVLATGNMSNGSITLSGEVNDTIPATISVEVGLEVPLTLDTVIAPGREVSFALFEWPTVLAFLGTVNSVQDSSQQFRIFGDLSSVHSDLEHATVTVHFVERDRLGEIASTTWHVLMQDDRFEVVGEVSEPRIVNVLVYKGVHFSQTQAVIEPGVEIEISTKTESLKDLYAFSPSGTSRHAILIDSWQQNPEYWAAKRWYADAVERHQKELISRKEPAAETTELQIDTEALSSNEETVDQKIEEKDSTEDTDECAEYVARLAQVNFQTPAAVAEDLPEHVKMFRELNRLRLDPLENLALNSQEPIVSLLALELGAYWGEPKRQDIYNRLASTLDSDIVKRRVTHDSNDHARFLNQQEKISSLNVGTKAPDFALSNLEGKKVELYDIVQNNQNVLVEFWASWCGPCIKSLPGLKDVYAKQRLDGFEIVSVSLDHTHSDWSDATKEYAIPWINLGEMQESSSEIAKLYHVSYIPKNYLLDGNGCIVNKDLSSTQLAQALEETEDNADTKDND